MDKDAILAALPKLETVDLEMVLAAGQQLLVGRAVALPQAMAAIAGSIVDAMSGVLHVTTTLSMLPIAAIKALDKQLPALLVYLNTNFKGWDTSKVNQLVFLKMIFGLLRDDLIKATVKPTHWVLIHNLHKVPKIIENAFPGYVGAALGALILKQFKQG